jgi:DUF4097 and DUF4098 domain-containing protein YvlB
MHRTLVLSAAIAALCLGGSAFASDGIDRVNGSIHVASGEHAGDLSTVNGGIRIDAGAGAAKASTVNGGIELGDNATVDTLETVNGGIELGAGARVARTIETVNGGIRLGKGADVAGRASNVNGRFELEAAHVGGGIGTVGGDIDIGADSHVEGGILVDEPHGSSWGRQRNPRIVIGPHAVVTGTLEFRRDVDLYVSSSAKVGEIKGATPHPFAGEQP